MRQVQVNPLSRSVSALGFGCAPLGSRIGAEQGGRAIAAALDQGVSWFDVAPPYGDGEAEGILGLALGARRKDVVICTKYGIARPTRAPLARRLLKPLARAMVAAAPRLRKAVAKGREPARRAPFTSAAIEESLVHSLRALRSDYVDVLAWHDPTPGEAADPELISLLDRFVQRGMARSVSIAGSPASATASLAAGLTVIAQIPNSPMSNAAAPIESLVSAASGLLVTHSVFDPVSLALLTDIARLRPEALAALTGEHRLGNAPLGRLLLEFAFGSNPEGVVLTTMFSEHHIADNAAIGAGAGSRGFARDLIHLMNEGSCG